MDGEDVRGVCGEVRMDKGREEAGRDADDACCWAGLDCSVVRVRVWWRDVISKEEKRHSPVVWGWRGRGEGS